ncbi:hypothetical protein HHI36_019646 [Cryptolaemus montrouzieri]|uniref:Uncharacterized protein n=1 Tax=Cryptolaemus montrouzieri TaxID=559131 RepID=A0ABD2N945_9CUCU
MAAPPKKLNIFDANFNGVCMKWFHGVNSNISDDDCEEDKFLESEHETKKPKYDMSQNRSNTSSSVNASTSYVSAAKSVPKPIHPKREQAIIFHAEGEFKLLDYAKAVGDIIGAKIFHLYHEYRIIGYAYIFQNSTCGPTD